MTKHIRAPGQTDAGTEKRGTGTCRHRDAGTNTAKFRRRVICGMFLRKNVLNQN